MLNKSVVVYLSICMLACLIGAVWYENIEVKNNTYSDVPSRELNSNDISIGNNGVSDDVSMDGDIDGDYVSNNDSGVVSEPPATIGQSHAGIEIPWESEISEAINDVTIPVSLDNLSLSDLESIDERVKNFFDEHNIIESINEDLMNADDKERVSELIRRVTEVRSKAIDIRFNALGEKIDVLKSDIASGKVAMPKPLTESDFQEIEEQARERYEEMLRQEEKRRAIVDSRNAEEETIFN